MQLTRFTDLGLRVVMRLAVAAGDELPSTRVVAQQMGISYAHTAKVVTRLTELGVVSARRGRGGGLAITELGRTATVGWLARRLEGSGEVVTCDGDQPCPLRGGCTLRSLLRDAQESFYGALDSVTIAELAEPPTKSVLLTLSRPLRPETLAASRAR